MDRRAAISSATRYEPPASLHADSMRTAPPAALTLGLDSDAALKALRRGDTLIVWKLDRLGRDLRHLINVIHDLSTRGIGFKVLTGHGANLTRPALFITRQNSVHGLTIGNTNSQETGELVDGQRASFVVLSELADPLIYAVFSIQLSYEMRWSPRSTLLICIGFGLSVLILVIHTFWVGYQDDSPHLAKQVKDLQLLVITLLAWAGFYSVAFLLSPNVSDQARPHAPRQLGKAVPAQLSETIGKIPELEEPLSQITSGQMKTIEEAKPQTAIAPARRLALEAPQTPAGGAMSQEYLHLSGGLRILNSGMVQVYQALASWCGAEAPATASAYLKQALSLGADPSAEAEIHYSLACLLARQGELGEAIIEVQTAFMNKSPELGRKLAKDTEDGGVLNELATREPYAQVLDDLVLAVTVGK